jgi:cobalt-zinc-cadmium resistance protein CzcA
MLITATAMVQARVSGNLMSLGAIDFGLIVDGAVIIVENCLRRLAERQHALGRTLSLSERLHEVMVASKEMIQPTVYGQAIIITVYVPILTLTGIEGKMFQPMAMTVIFALLAAFVLSLTFVPAMVAICIRGRVQEGDNVFVRWAKRGYEPLLRLALRLRYVVVPLAVAAFALSLLLFQRLGQEFVPTLDEQDIAIHAMRIPSTSRTQSTRMQFQVEQTLKAFPEVALVFAKTGTADMASDPMPPNVSDTFVMLKPRSEWPNPDEPKSALVERMEEALLKVPGTNYEFTQPIQMRFNELIAGVRSDVAVKVYGDNFPDMEKTAGAVSRILQDVPGAADVKLEQTTGLPVLQVRVDRAAIARYGLSVADVQEVAAMAIGGKEAGLVFEGDRRFPLSVRLPESIRHNLDALKTLPVPLPHEENDSRPVRAAALSSASARNGPRFIPLGELARLDVSEGPNQISRENGKRRVVVQANVRGRDLGSFVAEAQERIGREVSLPAGSWLSWGGQFENLIAARERLTLVVPACFFAIFLLLYSAFSSVKHALLVFTGVPLALTGGIVLLWLRDMPFSISAAVGFIALSGVAVLNGLVMVTHINQLRREGASLEAAIIQGSLTRLRPVLMTALVASLGFVPMALATGTGAEVQKPLATVVIGGLVTSTLLTLMVLPALYRLFERKEHAEP